MNSGIAQKKEGVPRFQRCPTCVDPPKVYSLKQIRDMLEEDMIKDGLFRCFRCKFTLRVGTDLRLSPGGDELKRRRRAERKRRSASERVARTVLTEDSRRHKRPGADSAARSETGARRRPESGEVKPSSDTGRIRPATGPVKRPSDTGRVQARPGTGPVKRPSDTDRVQPQPFIGPVRRPSETERAQSRPGSGPIKTSSDSEEAQSRPDSHEETVSYEPVNFGETVHDGRYESEETVRMETPSEAQVTDETLQIDDPRAEPKQGETVSFDQIRASIAGDEAPLDKTAAAVEEWSHDEAIKVFLEGVVLDIRRAVNRGEELQGRYKLEKIIGSGASGVVALAQDLEMERRVAAKFVIETAISGDDGEMAKSRVARTFHLQGLIVSPHAVRPVELVKTNKYGWVAVEEYVDGISLETVIDRKQTVNEETGVQIGMQISQVLKQAYEKGRIVHRDIKPANIMLREHDGVIRAILLDWGIARRNSTDRRDYTQLFLEDLSHIDVELTKTLTLAGVVLGTPHYMAPEQVLGARPDHRADVYGLGAALYHLLTGRTIHQGKNLQQLLEQVLHGVPMPASKAAELTGNEVSEALSDVLARATAKKPDMRFQSPTDFREALRKTRENKGKQRGSLFRRFWGGD